MNKEPTCKQCKYKTADHYCTHPQTQGKNGERYFARHVWFVSYNGREKDYCAGRYFESAEGVRV